MATADVRMRDLISRNRISLHEAFKDYDRHKHGYISKYDFQRGLRMAFERDWSKVGMSDTEFNSLCSAYASNKQAGYVNWRDFSSDMEQAVATSTFSSDGAVAMKQDGRWRYGVDENCVISEEHARSSQNRDQLGSQLASETKSLQKSSFDRVNEKLQEKIEQTQNLKHQIETQLNNTNTCIAEMEASHSRLEVALNDKKAPLQVVRERIDTRLQRPRRERIEDDFASALDDELANLQKCDQQLARALEKTRQTINDNLNSKKELELDLHDKTQSLELDMQCANIERGQRMNGAFALDHHEQELGVASNIGEGEEVKRKRSTHEIIHRACKLEEYSYQLRDYNDKLIAKCERLVAKHFKSTQAELYDKVSETKDMKNRLEDELNKTVNEIHRLQSNKKQLEENLADKEEPLAIATQRLHIRKQKPTREKIRDEVEENLEVEIRDLKACIAALHDELTATNRDIDDLILLKERLEQDLKDKSRALDLELHNKSLEKTLAFASRVWDGLSSARSDMSCDSAPPSLGRVPYRAGADGSTMYDLGYGIDPSGAVSSPTQYAPPGRTDTDGRPLEF